MTVLTQPALDLRKAVYKKPSLVVRAAAHGLQTHRDRDDFVINMGTFGRVTWQDVVYRPVPDGICMGCLATCAMQSISNVEFTPDNIRCTPSRAAAAGFSQVDTRDFELAVDALRDNSPRQLYAFCRLEPEDLLNVPKTVGIGMWLCTHPLPAENIDRAIEELTAFAETLEAAGY